MMMISTTTAGFRSRATQVLKRSRALALTAGVASLLFGAPAIAAPLNLILEPEPDIFLDFVSVSYVSATTTLTMSGFASNVDAFGNVNEPVTGANNFSLTANVTNAGVLTSGSFSILGNVAGFGWNSGTLLTGDLTAIGFPDGGAGALEFLFSSTGGDAAADFLSNGGMTIGIVNGYPGNWNSDFSASFSSSGDVGVVPEPSTGLLVAMGLGMMARRRGTRRI